MADVLAVVPSGTATVPVSPPAGQPTTAERTTAQRTTAEPATRGTLTVADRVIERIAAIAAGQVHGVVRIGSRWDTGGSGRLPRAQARTAGSRARLVVEIAVAWPSSLGEVAGGVRSAVTRSLQALAAVDADAVDVDVVRIVSPNSARRAS